MRSHVHPRSASDHFRILGGRQRSPNTHHHNCSSGFGSFYCGIQTVHTVRSCSQSVVRGLGYCISISMTNSYSFRIYPADVTQIFSIATSICQGYRMFLVLMVCQFLIARRGQVWHGQAYPSLDFGGWYQLPKGKTLPEMWKITVLTQQRCRLSSPA